MLPVYALQGSWSGAVLWPILDGCTGEEKSGSDLVDAFDAVNAIDATDVGVDGFELPLVDNFQARFDARILAIRPAFERSNVSAGIAEHGGNFGKQAGPVFGAHQKFDREGGRPFAAPGHGDAALRLIE